MARDTVHVGGYLPLFAGSEIVRRSGALTQFPSEQLLGNLPIDVVDFPWYDTFTSVGPQDLYDHVADYGHGTDRRYSTNCCGLLTVDGGRVTGPYGVSAATRVVAAPLNGMWSLRTWGALESGYTNWQVYGGGFPWSGFDAPLARIEYGPGTGPDNRIATIRRGRYNQETQVDTLQYTATDPIYIETSFSRDGAYATTFVYNSFGQAGIGGVTTAIPSAEGIYGEFILQDQAQLDELKLRSF